MSGGSYGYLCYKDATQITDVEYELNAMSERLAKLGYARDAAKETEEILLITRSFMNRIQTRIDRLSMVWRAVEWWDSGDSGEDGVKEALVVYREEQKQ